MSVPVEEVLSRYPSEPGSLVEYQDAKCLGVVDDAIVIAKECRRLQARVKELEDLRTWGLERLGQGVALVIAERDALKARVAALEGAIESHLQDDRGVCNVLGLEKALAKVEP